MIWYFDMLTSNETDTVGKERGLSQTEVAMEEKKAVHESGWKCVCALVWFARLGGVLRKVGLRWQTWEASKRLDAFACERRQEGVFGCARASPWPPNPQAQPSLQGMPQIWLSGSPRGRPSSASRFNMLCVPSPPAPLHLNHHCPRAGPPLLASRSLLKAPFKPGDVFG